MLLHRCRSLWETRTFASPHLLRDAQVIRRAGLDLLLEHPDVPADQFQSAIAPAALKLYWESDRENHAERALVFRQQEALERVAIQSITGRQGVRAAVGMVSSKSADPLSS